MNEREFSKLLAKIEYQFGMDGEIFAEIVEKMILLLDEADFEGFYGKEGWRRELDWE